MSPGAFDTSREGPAPLACSTCDMTAGEILAASDGRLWCVDCFEKSAPPAEPTEPSEDPLPLTDRRLPRPADGFVPDGGFDDGSPGPDRTAACARVIGIEVDRPFPTLGSFPCVLPGHDHSARLYPTHGRWQYGCRSGGPWGLAEVFAFRAYGDVRPLSRPLIARWRERLEHDAGLRKPQRVAVSVPDGASPAVRRVASRFALYARLRNEMWMGNDGRPEPYVFARGFVIAYCNVTDQQARTAVRELEEHGSLVRVGKRNACVLWRPRQHATLIEVLGSEDEVVQAIIAAFDAAEIEP